jgi:hypothetical protein
VVPESLVDSSASNVIVTWLSISECWTKKHIRMCSRYQWSRDGVCLHFTFMCQCFLICSVHL